MSRFRNSSTFFTLTSILLLLSLVLIKDSASATLVWADTFDDGNYDGWTVTYGSFSCAENNLISTQYSSTIHRPSTVTVGTWSFDLLIINSGSSGVHVCFFCESFIFYPITGYDLKVSRNGFELMYWLDNYDDCIGDYFPPFIMAGWQHVDITRDDAGLIRVYINDTLRIETVDNRIPTSLYFHLLSGPGEGLDNITVSDSIDITPTPGTNPGFPIFDLGPYLPLVALGIALACALGVGIILRRRYQGSR
ncbi:MAG: hypothetical protein ACFE89_03455 [Candidatus Hodarchaeota archaeon]